MIFRLSLVAAMFFFGWPGWLRAQSPLYERMPFNRITLTPQHNSTVVDVLPIDFGPAGRPNPLPRNRQEITVRFADSAAKEFTVQWNSIEKIELFPELVRDEFLEKLDALAKDVAALPPEEAQGTLGDAFDQAFQYLIFLADYRKEIPNYDRSYRKFLYEEAVYRVKTGDFVTGLTRFEALFSEDKNYPNLSRVWGSATEIALDSFWKSGREDLCRQYILRVREAFPEHDVVKQWDDRLFASTRTLCEQSRKAYANGDFVRAHLHCEQAGRIAPELPELIAWRRELMEKVPRIDVAVDAPVTDQLDRRQFGLPDRSTERARRLLRLGLLEYVRPSLEGGVYASPLGMFEKSARSKTLRWTFTEQSRQTLEFTVFDALETILDNPRNENRIAEFLLPEPGTMEVRLHDFSLIPEAPFMDCLVASKRFVPPPIDADANAPGAMKSAPRPGRFLLEQVDDKRNVFLPRKISSDPATPKVVFEHTALRGEEATELLLTGRVDLIDRLAPWEVERIRKLPSIITGRHAVPTVSFLVPNPGKPLTSSRTFRRALLYGLNRQRMLEKLADRSGEGSVLSAPFVKARILGDPLGYAYDPLIAPRPYDPKLAMALSLLAFNQQRDRDPAWEEFSAIPEIVLACPERETSELVALMIRRQWEALRLRVRVVFYRDNETIGRDDSVDFWLVERNLKEPLVDAQRIFGIDGMHGNPSPYMELALERLRQSRDWAEAGKSLREIHRLCFEETTVLPLWQLTEFYAHREGLTGIEPETGLVDLYQNIRHWQISPGKTR